MVIRICKVCKQLKRQLAEKDSENQRFSGLLQAKTKEIKELKHPKNKKERCIHCNNKRNYSDKYDAYYCKKCDYWLEKICCDKNCDFCENRPKYPSGDKQHKEDFKKLIEEIDKLMLKYKSTISYEGLKRAKKKIKEIMK